MSALVTAASDPQAKGFPLAMQVLGERGDATMVEMTGVVLQGNPMGMARMGSLRYLRHLPPTVSLPVAREWWEVADGRGDAADMILARHAEPEDVPRLRQRLATCHHAYTQCNMVDGLARVPGLGPYPELRTVFQEACYSYLRRRSVLAMVATDPGYPHVFAEECLWDCESAIREAGVRSAPLLDRVKHRMVELAMDEAEDSDVRDAAVSRLTGPSPA